MDKKLEQAMRSALEAMGKNSVEVTYDLVENGIRNTLSRFGGKPSVPQGFRWPYFEGKSYENVVADRPLAFLTEIYLSEVAPLDPEGLLPKSGVLSFFYEMETEKWGFDPKDKGCARVFYFENENALSESDFPADLHSDYHFPEFDMTFEQKVSLPSYEDFYGTPQEKEISARFPEETNDCGFDGYDELKKQLGCLTDEWGDRTRLLGYPDVIQNPMERECEEVTRGFYNGRKSEIPCTLEAEIEQASKDWILLFQMGTVGQGDFELMFGDCGHLYFWIRKQDLADKNFDKIWLILQCS